MSFCRKFNTSKGKPGIEVIVSPDFNHRLEGSSFERIICNGGKVIYGKVVKKDGKKIFEDNSVRIVGEFKNEEDRDKANKDIWEILFRKESDYADDEED